MKLSYNNYSLSIKTYLSVLIWLGLVSCNSKLDKKIIEPKDQILISTGQTSSYHKVRLYNCDFEVMSTINLIQFF